MPRIQEQRMASESYDGDMGGGRLFSRRRLSGKKIITVLVIIALLLVGGVIAARFFGLFGGGDQTDGSTMIGDATKSLNDLAGPTQTNFFDLPEMLINLRSDQPRPSFLKLSVSLEIDRIEDRAVLSAVLPRITDTFQVYLRELHPDQLQGAEGLLRLREELLSRINAAVSPVVVRDVLFREMLVQ
ncbi:MAG: flagellar basal body-associated FliL family protein [Alphaproteobacteria bacterium]|nr:flagellar basal body-associated FliL family protein [Alphaproteobacteria bacterium]